MGLPAQGQRYILAHLHARFIQALLAGKNIPGHNMGLGFTKAFDHTAVDKHLIQTFFCHDGL
jgi:hypothetical protein